MLISAIGRERIAKKVMTKEDSTPNRFNPINLDSIN